MQGGGFNLIPNDAVGVIAINNDEPLEFRDSDNARIVFDIIEKGYNNMKVKQRVLSTHSTPSYLGAILSSDRQTEYWVNNMRPLP